MAYGIFGGSEEQARMSRQTHELLSRPGNLVVIEEKPGIVVVTHKDSFNPSQPSQAKEQQR